SKQESGIKRRSSHFSCVNTVPVNTYSVSLIDNNKKMVDHNLIESRDYPEIKEGLERGLLWRLNPNNLEHVMSDENIKTK
ncbi:hypothetical protein ACK4AA_20795, partial [Aeromonas veronii]